MRGYALVGRRSLPRALPRRAAATRTPRSRGCERSSRLDGVAQFRAEIDAVAAAARGWRAGYAEPTIAPVRSDPARGARRSRQVEAGKARFDAFRAAVDRPPGAARSRRASDGARRAATATPTSCSFWVLVTGIVILLSVLVVALRACAAARAAAAARSPARVRERRARRLRARGRRLDGAREVVDLGEDVDAMRARIVAELEALRDAEADLQALQRRARAVRLRRLARPPGAAAQGRELLPAAPAALRRPARRARRPVHRLRRRRRAAHAGPDQRPAGVLARRADRAAAHRRRLRRAGRARARADLARAIEESGADDRGRGRAADRARRRRRCCGSCSRT